MKRLLCALVATLSSLLLVPLASPAVAAPPALGYGTVVALVGTPHIWIADEQGMLHWNGDTRALAQHFVNWGDKMEVNLAQLMSYRRGDPWLSSGLVKDGEPIYLSKWESSADRPALVHIASIADVEIFGINATNYGQFVIDRAQWEARFGFTVPSLAKAELPPAATPAPETVLYQADWSQGLNGWVASQPGWATVNGMLVNTAPDPAFAKLTAPLQSPFADYAVEAQFQLLRRGSYYEPDAVIHLRGDQTRSPQEGYSFGVCSTEARIGVADTSYGAYSPCSFIKGTPFDPGTDWHVYRAEAKGNSLTLSIDGVRVLQATDNRFLTGSLVGLEFTNVAVQIRSFRVIAL